METIFNIHVHFARIFTPEFRSTCGRCFYICIPTHCIQKFLVFFLWKFIFHNKFSVIISLSLSLRLDLITLKHAVTYFQKRSAFKMRSDVVINRKFLINNFILNLAHRAKNRFRLCTQKKSNRTKKKRTNERGCITHFRK